MAGEVKFCTNCGNQQAAGEFCEKCGTRMAAPVAGPMAAAPAQPFQAAPGQQPAYPQYAQQPYQYGAQPQYLVVRQPGPFSKLFDFSFQGFVTRGSLGVVFGTTLFLLAGYFIFALVLGIVTAAKGAGWMCLTIFTSLFVTAVMIIWTRVIMELATTMSSMRDDMARAAAEAKQQEEEKAAKTKK